MSYYLLLRTRRGSARCSGPGALASASDGGPGAHQHGLGGNSIIVILFTKFLSFFNKLLPPFVRSNLPYVRPYSVGLISTFISSDDSVTYPLPLGIAGEYVLRLRRISRLSFIKSYTLFYSFDSGFHRY